MKHHILSIGISAYQNQSIRDLEFASKDATDFINLFTSNISSIGYKKLLVDSEASLSQIRTALGFELQKELNEEDAFFFYFSGHGTNCLDREEELSNYLVTYDATNDIVNSCLSVSYILDVFKNLKSKANILIIDTCFSGSADLTKGFTTLSIKSDKPLKSFNNQVSGQGIVAMTACGDAEESLEDPEHRNGLFTKIFLDQLISNDDNEKVSFVDLYTPVSEKVKERASSKYNHKQTPSLSGRIQDVLYLPPFKNKIELNPDFMDYPKYTEVPEIIPHTEKIQFDDTVIQDLLNRTIEFVIRERELISKTPEKYSQISFEKFCIKLMNDINIKWEEIYKKPGGIETISDKLAELEIASIQFTILGCVLAVYGSDKQMKIYSEQLNRYIKMTKNKQGIVSILSIPEIIIVETIYCIGILCLANEYLKPLKIVLETKIWDDKSCDTKPKELISTNKIFYSDTFNGNADKVQDYISEVISNYGWLDEILPKLKNVDNKNLIIQTNFILFMLSSYKNVKSWYDFARFYGHRLISLIQKIKYDKEFLQQLNELFNVEPDSDNLLTIFHECLEAIYKVNMGGYRWMTIQPDDLKIDSNQNSDY